MRLTRPTAALGLLAAALTTSVTGAPASAGPPAGATAAAHVTTVTVHRGGADATIRFNRARAGEAFLTAAVSARGISWDDAGNESAVVSVHVDGHYATDIVITSSAAVKREFALGHLDAGRHTLRVHYATNRSPSDAGVARLEGIGVTTVPSTSPEYAAARFAPVLFGRNVAARGSQYQNNHTDTPLIAWHQVSPAQTAGHSVIEYSVVWSNEDGGTLSQSLMAQWGRTTDIEWVYRVEINARGGRVPGSGVFQGPFHETKPFQGVYDGTHPVIQTCTDNNNVCDSKTLRTQRQAEDPMRFALSTRDVLPADQARETEMDLHAWTYQVMAREMVREGKIEAAPDPNTVAVGDQRTYLYLTVDHATTPTTDGVGLAVDVQLHGNVTFSSDHLSTLPQFFTVNRDGPAATTVELPAGTTAADIESISVRRVPIGTTDNGATLHVTDLGRAFFLGTRYLPAPSFAQLPLDVTLTTAEPTAQIWPPLPG
jgi:hypothetical protein